MTHETKLLNTFGPERSNKRSKTKTKNKHLYPKPNDEKFFERKKIDNSKQIQDLKSSLIYLSRKNVLDNIESIDSSNILWTSGINCWTSAVSRGYWINGTSDSFGELSGVNIKNFMPKNFLSYKLRHDKSSDDNYELISVYKLSVRKNILNNMDLENRTHFFWMSPLQFDLALEYFPEIINGNHSCGFGRTYNHLKDRLPNGKNVTRFHSYKSWLELYQGD